MFFLLLFFCFTKSSYCQQAFFSPKKILLCCCFPSRGSIYIGCRLKYVLPNSLFSESDTRDENDSKHRSQRTGMRKRPSVLFVPWKTCQMLSRTSAKFLDPGDGSATPCYENLLYLRACLIFPISSFSNSLPAQIVCLDLLTQITGAGHVTPTTPGRVRSGGKYVNAK